MVLVFFFSFLLSVFAQAELYVGIGKAEITPPIGTPSAGYTSRKGEGMIGVHDPLLAIALFIDNGEKKIAFCSVDHLGFTYEMVQRITERVQKAPGLSECQVYIGSSHTHSGGGSFWNIPVLGEVIAGPYKQAITQFYEEQTAKAIIESTQNPILAKIGIGYGNALNLSTYRALWPRDVSPLSDVAVIKVTKLDESPFAVLFNFPVHPTLLTSENRLFSADFVGYARDHIQSLLGNGVQALYFNGAQGDINPIIANEVDRFESCSLLGKSLALAVDQIWRDTAVSDELQIASKKEPYSFKPEPTPQGMRVPLDLYKTEMNLLVFNQRHAFITIPGELSSIYDRRLKEVGKKRGYQQVSIFGLVNDAHGYIILPESWEHKTTESNLSFGGKQYGDTVEAMAEKLLKE